MTRAVDGMKQCSKCSVVKPIEAFSRRRNRPDGHHYHCRECMAAACRRWDREHVPERVAHHRHLTLRRRGITAEQYDELLESQRGVCAVCGGPPTGKGRFHIDHDHRTGRTRGLLCLHCNILLGMARENRHRFYRAMSYLDRFDDRPVVMPWEDANAKPA